MTQLEKSVGARLLNRTTRAMSLTESGAVFYEHCARIVEELEAAKDAVGQLHSQPRGLLRVSASVAFGTMHIAPALPDFLARYPEVKIDMEIKDRFVDLADERFDVAIRITKEPGPNLVARRLATVKRQMCATPAYFKRHGVPRTPKDLEDHNCLTYTYFNPQDPWRLRGPDGDISVAATGNLRLNDDEALSEAFKMVKKPTEGRPAMVVFMTDGEPTIGETDPEAIIRNAKKNAPDGVRVFSFGVGTELNAMLLDRLSAELKGTPEYATADEEIEVKVSSFASKINSPIMTDLSIDF
jgi:hypothetical protein